jgi:hypothetical protein
LKSGARRFLKERDDPNNEKDNAGHRGNEGQSWKRMFLREKGEGKFRVAILLSS